MQLGEVGRFRRPVVHLRVDVDRVVRAPRRPHFFVPDALEVRRLGAGPARRDQQVAAVLEEQLDEPGIGSAARGDPPIGRQILGRRGRQLQRHAIEQRAMIGDVGVAQRGPRGGASRGDLPHDDRAGVAAVAGRILVEAVERRRRREQHRGGVGAFDAKAGRARRDACRLRRRRRRPARSACPAASGVPCAAAAFRPRPTGRPGRRRRGRTAPARRPGSSSVRRAPARRRADGSGRLRTVTACRSALATRASKVTRPGRSAAIRTAMTPAGALAITSRV